MATKTVKTLDDILRHLEDQSATEARTVAEMLESIAGNDDSEMQTPEHLITCLQELIMAAGYTIRLLRDFPPSQPIPRG